jgi:D-glycero-D-manno-heptose 1,7-bisphosphate phosphatase
MFTVFVDRDGVINRKAPEGQYITTWSEFEFLPGAVEGLSLLKRAGWLVIVVTNQRGVALGRMTAKDLDEIHTNMCRHLATAGADPHAIYSCTHDNGACECRKPQIGMFLQAQQQWPAIDFAMSAMIGDSPIDMEAAGRLKSKKVGMGRAATLPGIDYAAESIEQAAREYLLPWSLNSKAT